MLRYLNVAIRRSELATQHREVAAWEVPLIEAVFPDGVEVLNELFVDRPAPDVKDEYQRLAVVYRQSTEEDGSKGPLHVASVYGQHGPGLQALKLAIKENTVESAPDGAVVKGPPKKRVKIGDLF